MWFRGVLVACLLSVLFVAGRQSWIVTSDNVRTRVASDVVEMHRAQTTAGFLLVLADDLGTQLGRLRVLNSTCLVVVKCTPGSAIAGAQYLDLQEKRIQIFADMANMVDRATRLGANSPEGDVIKFEFAEKAVEYNRLLPEIDALKDGVPSEIARALEPLH